MEVGSTGRYQGLLLEPWVRAIEMEISADIEDVFGVEGQVRYHCSVSLNTV